MTTRPAYILTLRPEPAHPGEPDATTRLRRALKALLRVYGLRCTSIVESAPVERSDTTPIRTHDESSEADGRATVRMATDARPGGEQ